MGKKSEVHSVTLCFQFPTSDWLGGNTFTCIRTITLRENLKWAENLQGSFRDRKLSVEFTDIVAIY